MAYRAIISDWNGTIFELETDEKMNRSIAYAAKDYVLGRIAHGQVWKIKDAWRLFLTKGKINRALAAYSRGQVPLKDIYKLFNAGVLNGLPLDVFNAGMASYLNEHPHRLDNRLLPSLQAAHNRGIRTGILSLSYLQSIISLLEQNNASQIFDTIVSHRLASKDGKAIGFTTDIYGRKAGVLENDFFRNRGLRPESTLYIGDGDEDEPIADVLPPGNFIVPFLAGDDFRQKMASKHSAFVPESPAELARFLDN